MHFIDKINIAWTGDFECLKQFTNEFLKLHGDWSQPGGDKKVFACNYLIRLQDTLGSVLRRIATARLI